MSYGSHSRAPVVTCFGAARTVTGSMHLVEANGRRVLLDCGMFRSPREHSRPHHHSFPFDPTTLDAVVLSHAHTDHCGNLPELVRQGFAGPIFCTPATRDLTEIMLADLARIQEGDEFVQAVVHAGGSPVRAAHLPAGDVQRATSQLVGVPYGQPIAVCPGVEAQFHDAGHILGSAIVALTAANGAKDYRITFTGDLGRRGLPFLPDPSPLPAADLVLCESTYGGRLHDDAAAMARKMSTVVHAAVARGGKILVPAFSLGRTQAVVHYLRKWMREGVLPRLPLFIDSPLASEVAAVYDAHAGSLADPDLSGDPPARYVSAAEALRATTSPEPCVIVASGGMCDTGRIGVHLRHHIDDPRAVIVLVSYQAPTSLGAKLLERGPAVRFQGRKWNKWVEVVQMNGFSGHADHNDLLHLLRPLADPSRRVCLVHGEPHASERLATALRPLGFGDVRLAERGAPMAL